MPADPSLKVGLVKSRFVKSRSRRNATESLSLKVGLVKSRLVESRSR